jgi:hypothetical protein
MSARMIEWMTSTMKIGRKTHCHSSIASSDVADGSLLTYARNGHGDIFEGPNAVLRQV